VQLALSTVRGDGTAESALRDEMIAMHREGAETTWRELRRAADEFDALTRNGASADPTRRYRVKR
jgi:hypothetical protein